MALEGVCDAKRIPVSSDAMDIVNRIKEMDKGYFVMYRRDTGAFEVHYSGGNPQRSYQLTLPYPMLDARAVEWVQRTSIEHLDRLVAQMDAINAAREAGRSPNAAGRTT
nr:hypothetical protein [bacterium]